MALLFYFGAKKNNLKKIDQHIIEVGKYSSGRTVVAITLMTDLVNALAPLLIAFLSLLLSTYLFVKQRRELSLSEQIANAPDFLYKEYVDRELGKPIKIDGETYTTLRDARNAVRNRVKKEKEILPSIETEAWSEFTYQLSVALQSVGMLVLEGAIPIKLVLPSISDLILEDWHYCYDTVQQHRASKKTLTDHSIRLKAGENLSTPIYFQGRHAEWLFAAAAIYLYNHWEIPTLNESLRPFKDIKELEQRELQLRKSEPNIVSKKTSKEINNFLYK